MIRCGIGYDLHRLTEGRPLMIGGVHVPFDKGPVGHSDGDVLAHALCDALLGASGLGDIGTHFPDTDPAYSGADSMDLLGRVVLSVTARFEVGNVDVTVVLEAPKLAPHREAMERRLEGVHLVVDHIVEHGEKLSARHFSAPTAAGPVLRLK